MAMGVAIGHVEQTYMGLVTLVGLVTIAISTYMITYSHHLYDLFERWLRPFERRIASRELAAGGQHADVAHEIILFGLGRYGRAIGRGLIDRGHSVLGVDFDPEAIAAWRADGHQALFGDATDPEFLAHLPLTSARVLISTVPSVATGLSDIDPRLALLRGLREQPVVGRVAVAMRTDYDVQALRELGADLVLSPYADAATYAVESVEALLRRE
jgi:hypothetical protein